MSKNDKKSRFGELRNAGKGSVSSKNSFRKPAGTRPERVVPGPVNELPPRGPMAEKNRCVGILHEGEPDNYVDPDPGYSFNQYGKIRIRANHMNGAPLGMKVVCEIINPMDVAANYEGNIIEVLGDPGISDIAILSILRQYGIPEAFSAAVLEQAEAFPVHPTPKDIDGAISGGRRDLRSMRTITIDGEDAKDLDDAISIEKIPGKGFKLFVHIADVSHYVTDLSEIDQEAEKRGTSVYLVDRVVPMLPPRLSNGLCSLNPQVPRFTLTASMTIDYQGEVLDGEIFESIIQSNARTSYKEIYGFIYQNEEIERYEEFREMFGTMKELKDILSDKRDRRGSLNFNFPETHVTLDDTGKPTDIFEYPINEANGIIEEFMIVCNEFVAERYEMMKYPFIYRIHEDPDERKIAEFLHIARVFGAKSSFRGKATPEYLAALMKQIEKETFAPALSQLLLRSLAKARYSSENAGHFGLNSKHYCHFTSPIRRYPDLYIHRIIKSDLHHEQKRAYFAAKVSGIADHSSDMERNSVEAERATTDQKISEYMTQHIGETFDGMISGMFHAGIFVRLENTVEGMAAFRSMDDYYEYDENKLEARGRTGGKVFRIGQSVRVKVVAADPVLRRIDFLVESPAGEKRIQTNVKKEVRLRSSRKHRNEKGRKRKS